MTRRRAAEPEQRGVDWYQDAPGCPRPLTVADLIGLGLAHEVPVGKTGHSTYISPAGHRRLVDNQAERVAYNKEHR